LTRMVLFICGSNRVIGVSLTGLRTAMKQAKPELMSASNRCRNEGRPMTVHLRRPPASTGTVSANRFSWVMASSTWHMLWLCDLFHWRRYRRGRRCISRCHAFQRERRERTRPVPPTAEIVFCYGRCATAGRRPDADSSTRANHRVTERPLRLPT
jgi:hypothetical protein